MQHREFLARSLQAAAAARAISIEQLQASSRSAGAWRFSDEQRRDLRAAMDDIIPADGRMPSVSSVGGVQYILKLSAAYPEISELITGGLESLGERSRKASRKSFALSAAAQRIQVLRAMEKEDNPRGFLSHAAMSSMRPTTPVHSCGS